MDTETASTLAGMEIDGRARVDLAAMCRLPAHRDRASAIFSSRGIPPAEPTRARLLTIPPRIGGRHAMRYEAFDRGRASAERPVWVRRLDGIDLGNRA
jgi:hypothetical protein